MNATKRKFNALLNGIGTKSTTNVSSKEANNADSTSTTSAESQTKKRRIADFSSTKESSSSHLRPNPTMRDKNIRSMIGPESGDTPKYAPWDRTAFLQRLKSFSNLTDWTPKPSKVNEVEWAKRGWVCQKLERVRCSLCNIEILVKLNRKEVDGKEVPVYVAQNIGMLSEKLSLLALLTFFQRMPLWKSTGNSLSRLTKRTASGGSEGVMVSIPSFLNTRNANILARFYLQATPQSSRHNDTPPSRSIR